MVIKPIDDNKETIALLMIDLACSEIFLITTNFKTHKLISTEVKTQIAH